MRQHIVICGHSRAGTTLLHEVLRQELSDDGWQFYDQERTFEAADQSHRKVVTKRPLDVFKHQQLKRYAEQVDLRVLLCIRDPRSMLTSYHQSVPNDYFYHADHQYRVGRRDARLVNPGLLPVHHALMAIHGDPSIPSEIARYEDTLDRSYRPGSTPAGMARALNGDREMDRSRLDAWQDHWPRLVDQFTRYPELFYVMHEYGYSLENFEGVGGIPPAPKYFDGGGVC